MDTLQAILTRKSIRKYTNADIELEKIDKILQAAMYAPSAGNAQPWHFILLTDRKFLDEIPDFHPYSQMLKICKIAILVCADPELEKYKGRWMQDCSAATENILLAAHNLGLGAVWVGLHPVQERIEGVKNLLALPENIIPFAIVPLGYPAEKRKVDNRFKKERIHFNGW
jgi:nitroreductase